MTIAAREVILGLHSQLYVAIPKQHILYIGSADGLIAASRFPGTKGVNVRIIKKNIQCRSHGHVRNSENSATVLVGYTCPSPCRKGRTYVHQFTFYCRPGADFNTQYDNYIPFNHNYSLDFVYGVLTVKYAPSKQIQDCAACSSDAKGLTGCIRELYN